MSKKVCLCVTAVEEIKIKTSRNMQAVRKKLSKKVSLCLPAIKEIKIKTDNLRNLRHVPNVAFETVPTFILL